MTFGATMVNGTSGAIAKLLALPVFCIVVVVTRMVSLYLPSWDLPVLKSMLTLKVTLLAAAAWFAIAWGPFSHGDNWQAVFTGMTLVSGMAIQNAAHRVHLGKAPPSTLMTGTSTQIMIDIGDILSGRLSETDRIGAHTRLANMSLSVGAFAVGCAAAALIFATLGMKVFLLPPLVALFALLVIHPVPDPHIA